MYPTLGSLFTSSSTSSLLSTKHFSSQSKTNSCFNENYSFQANRFPMYTTPTYPCPFADQQSMFDFDSSEQLSPEFNNLFLYEPIWAPISSTKQTKSTCTTKETKSSYKQTTSKNSQLINPIAQSTPRAIRKESREESKQTFNDKRSEPQNINGFLRPKKVDNEPKLNKKKTWNEKNLNSSFSFSETSTSPKSNHSSYKQRNLPLRSKGVDLSSFLNKLSDTASVNSSDYSFGNNFRSYCYGNKGSVQNKCLFCENNGESEEIYTSHPLKDSLGKVVCPILRSFKCPKCGESGDYAHTNKYCPETQRKQKEIKIRKFFNQKD